MISRNSSTGKLEESCNMIGFSADNSRFNNFKLENLANIFGEKKI